MMKIREVNQLPLMEDVCSGSCGSSPIGVRGETGGLNSIF